MKKGKIIISAAIVIIIALIGFVYVSMSKPGLEIERKWVIDPSKMPYELDSMECFDITQTYINYSPEIRVRKIVNDGITYYTTTTKEYVNDQGLVREETESYITEEEYNSAVAKGLDSTIYKNRYQIEINGLTYAFDIFKGELEGLAYLEIEFESEDEANAFAEPDWIIKDVTNDRRYKNQELAKYGMPEI